MAGAAINASVRPSRIVGGTGLERELTIVCDAAVESCAGVFGPSSMMWHIDKEAAIFLGAGRALLLQLAHPWIAAAIAQHSQTLADPIGRFHRTFNRAGAGGRPTPTPSPCQHRRDIARGDRSFCRRLPLSSQ